jgi:hypothetical protein
MGFHVNNHTKPSRFDRMRNFYAWKESAYESRTLPSINVLANNLINRIWGELWRSVGACTRSALRHFYAWVNFPLKSGA